MGTETFPAQEARSIGERALGRVRADDAVLRLVLHRSAVTRFANNAITQNVAAERREASLTVAFGQKKGTAQAGSFEQEAIESLVARAEAVARAAPADPEHLPSLGPQTYVPVEARFEETARLTAEDRARFARSLIDPARAAGLSAAGTVEIAETTEWLMTSAGLFAHHARTDAEMGLTATGPDSSGWARDAGPDVSRIDAAALAREAVGQAHRAGKPARVPPGKYTVLLMPPALGLLAQHLVMWADARTTGEGLTYLSTRLGKKLAGEAITIRSDPADPRLPGRPFNGEGVPKRRAAWVDRGVFNQLHHDRFTAKKSGVEPVPFPGPLFMEGTEKSVDDLAASIDRGILVTHFWYVRSVKDDETLVTGMTRDGTFLIEGGKVRGGVKNLRFNESCLGMLERTIALGRPRTCTDVEVWPSVFPPIVVRDWNFVSATDF